MSGSGKLANILQAKIDLTIDANKGTYRKGDRYYIPEGVLHSGKIYAGYADLHEAP